MTRVARVELFTATLPFRFSFGHALAERASSTNVYVRVTLDDGTVGVGEGVPREYVTGETEESALAALRDRWVPALLGLVLDHPGEVPAALERVATSARHGSADVVGGAAWCALELAVLDAAGRRFGRSVREWLGPLRAPVVTYSAVIPFTRPGRLAVLALAVRLLRIPHVKLKVGLGLERDLRALHVLRRCVGRGADIRVDANAAWSPDEALESIARMRPYGVSAVEQPVEAADLRGLARVTAATPELILVDESLRTSEEARALIAAQACNGFNVRVSKCGGLLASARIAALGAEAGLTIVVGAQVGESGFLSAAGRHLAAAVAPRWVEGSAGALLLREDLSEERQLPGFGGRARPFIGAGLGVRIRERTFQARARLQHRLDAGGGAMERAS